MRITIFPLRLRSDSPYSESEELPSLSTSLGLEGSGPLSLSLSKSKSKSAKSPDEPPPPYISLLSSQPYVISPALDNKNGLPSTPRLSLPPAPPGSTKTDFQLTPDTLRYLGTTVKKFSEEIHSVTLAYRAAESRTALQEQELKRIRETCADLLDRIERMQGSRKAEMQEKAGRLKDAQVALMRRLDSVLNALTKKASPELSENETKWFEELGRMREEVVGAGRYDERSLVARTKLVCTWTFLSIE